LGGRTLTIVLFVTYYTHAANASLIRGMDVDLKVSGRRLLQVVLDANGIPLWYPGRPTGICTSRGHLCSDIVKGKPYHVLNSACETSRSKTLRDRFGRPLTIRYTYQKKTYVANREQVCDLKSHFVSNNRTQIAENIDDMIWKNLSIWSKEFEYMWSTPQQKEQYIRCHEYFARFHCSSMFPNCTAEVMDQKPALPCKEMCEQVMAECTWQENDFFLPYELQCSQYPSKDDHYKKCTEVNATGAYVDRIAAAPSSKSIATMAVLSLAFAALHSAWDQ